MESRYILVSNMLEVNIELKSVKRFTERAKQRVINYTINNLLNEQQKNSLNRALACGINTSIYTFGYRVVDTTIGGFVNSYKTIQL